MANNSSLISPIGRVSHPHVFEVNEYEGRRTFNITLLIPKDHPWIKETQAKMEAALKELFKGKMPKNWQNPIKDGDDEAEEKGKPEFAGNYLVKFACSEDRRPGVVDQNREPITDKSKLYAGCYARVSHTIYAYNHSSGTKGVRLTLNNVQFCKDGERFGAATPDAEDEFDAIETVDADDIF